MAKRLTHSQPSSSKRFDFDIDDDDFEDMFGFLTANTTADTDKCVQLFRSWADARNVTFPRQKVPESILLTDIHPHLGKWLCRSKAFACEEVENIAT